MRTRGWNRIVWGLLGIVLLALALGGGFPDQGEATQLSNCGVELGIGDVGVASFDGTHDPNSRPPCGGAASDCNSGGYLYK